MELLSSGVFLAAGKGLGPALRPEEEGPTSPPHPAGQWPRGAGNTLAFRAGADCGVPVGSAGVQQERLASRGAHGWAGGSAVPQ